MKQMTDNGDKTVTFINVNSNKALDVSGGAP
ncbi:RICIN domain-containing protein [Paenibacillus sp. HW567]|nr:RICIN domain-containing protein [Paenibacillus sp. HW567]